MPITPGSQSVSSEHISIASDSNLYAPWQIETDKCVFIKATQLFSSCYICGNAPTFTFKHSCEFYCRFYIFLIMWFLSDLDYSGFFSPPDHIYQRWWFPTTRPGLSFRNFANHLSSFLSCSALLSVISKLVFWITRFYEQRYIPADIWLFPKQDNIWFCGHCTAESHESTSKSQSGFVIKEVPMLL